MQAGRYARRLGEYVTAVATDLGDEAWLGRTVVVHGRVLRWDEAERVEWCRDISGEYRLRPKVRTGLPLARPDDKVILGWVVSPGVLQEISSWGTDEVLATSPVDFATAVAAASP